jgi:hypothetical protein
MATFLTFFTKWINIPKPGPDPKFTTKSTSIFCRVSSVKKLSTYGVAGPICASRYISRSVCYLCAGAYGRISGLCTIFHFMFLGGTNLKTSYDSMIQHERINGCLRETSFLFSIIHFKGTEFENFPSLRIVNNTPSSLIHTLAGPCLDLPSGMAQALMPVRLGLLWSGRDSSIAG